MKAVVLERNKLVGRRIARLWMCAGLDVTTIEDPADLGKVVHQDVAVVGADVFDVDTVRKVLKGSERLKAVLWTTEPMDRVLRAPIEEPRISNIFGRASHEDTPRDWELLMVGRRLLRAKEPGAPLSAYLYWGATGFQDTVKDTAGRDATVGKVQKHIERLGMPKRVQEMFGELAHELIMNAIYDAPADASGKARFAHDRKANVTLEPKEAAQVRLAADGARLAIQVTDPFGRLERKHVFDGLARGLRGGTMDHSHGGAGLGMTVCHNATVAMVYDVVRGQRTEVTGIFDLDMNLREFRTQAKSLHYFEAQPAQ
jgi:hypothetical protein